MADDDSDDETDDEDDGGISTVAELQLSVASARASGRASYTLMVTSAGTLVNTGATVSTT